MTKTSRTDQNSLEPHLAASRDWRHIALWLVGATMAYNVAEGVVG
jgi:hypothetical protein